MRRALMTVGRACCFALALEAGMFSSNAGAAAEKVKISYAEPAADYVGLFMGIEKGYYAQEGIDVELVRAGGGTAIPALIAGDLQFSTSASTSISAILKGAHLKIIYVNEDRPDLQLWATQPSIQSLEDLHDKQVGVITRGDTGEVALRYLLMKRRLPPDFLAYTPAGPGPGRLAMVASQTLPAALLYWLEAGQIKTDAKFKHAHLLVDLRQETRMAFNGVVATDQLLAAKPDLVLRFVRSTLKGNAFAKAHRAETVALLARYETSTRDSAGAEYDHIVPAIVADGVVPQDIQSTELRLRADMLGTAKDGYPPLADVFDFSAVRAARAELLDRGWKP